jgi:hypothetical protein
MELLLQKILLSFRYNIQLQGRKSEKSNAIHTGNVQAKSIFKQFNHYEVHRFTPKTFFCYLHTTNQKNKNPMKFCNVVTVISLSAYTCEKANWGKIKKVPKIKYS